MENKYTYDEIALLAEQHIVDKTQRIRFLLYVVRRGFINKDHYIIEWAGRFNAGVEMERSDPIGQGILYDMDNEDIEKSYTELRASQ